MPIRKDLGLTDAFRNFWQAYTSHKGLKEQELQDEFYRNLAEQKFIEDKKWRAYLQQKETEMANKPQVIGGQDTGYYSYRPGEQPGTGPYPADQYEQLRQIIPPVQKPAEPPALKTVPPGNVYGYQAPGGEFVPQGQVPFKPEAPSYLEDKRLNDMATNAAKAAAGGDIEWESLSPEQRQQWIDHYKVQIQQGNQYPQAPQINVTQPYKKSNWLGRGGQEAIADTSFITPGQMMVEPLTPQEQEIVNQYTARPDLEPDWDLIARDYPDTNIEKMRKALGR